MTEEEKKEFEEFLEWKAEKAKKEALKNSNESNKDVDNKNITEAVKEPHNKETPSPLSPEQNDGSSSMMPIIIGIIAIIIVVIVIGTCTGSKSSKSSASIAPAEDSTEVILNEPAQEETIFKDINRDSIVNIMKADFLFKKDEFSSTGGSWVEPKTRPKYRNTNSFYCYFWINNYNYPSNFRFVMQYEADSWLFIKNCVFNIDGDNYNYYPNKMERDNNSRIWEWFDDPVTTDNIHIIRLIANAKSVKVKLNGNQYYDTRTIKPKEIASIKNTLEKYEELGGNFK